MKRKEQLKELREKKTADELKEDLMQARRKLNDLYLKEAIGKLKHNHEIKSMRKQIAHLLSIMQEKKHDQEVNV